MLNLSTNTINSRAPKINEKSRSQLVNGRFKKNQLLKKNFVPLNLTRIYLILTETLTRKILHNVYLHTTYLLTYNILYYTNG